MAVAPPREKSRLPWAITKAAPTLATITRAACIINVSILEIVRNLPPVVRLKSKKIMINPINGTADFKSNFSFFLFSFIVFTHLFLLKLCDIILYRHQIITLMILLSVSPSERLYSPDIRPSFMISTRSAMPRTSGISSDIIIIDLPFSFNSVIRS